MAMDPGPESNILGIKIGVAVAGFLGGVVCLSWLRGLSHPQAAMAVMTGAITASYVTPAAMAYLHWTPPLENFAAFVIGLTAMNIIPGVLRLSEMFKRDPARFLRGGDDK
jgi:hypothetical protein